MKRRLLSITALALATAALSDNSAQAQQTPSAGSDTLNTLNETLSNPGFSNTITAGTGIQPESLTPTSPLSSSSPVTPLTQPTGAGSTAGGVGSIGGIGGATNSINNTIGGVTDTIGGVTGTIDNTLGGVTDTIGGVTGTIDNTLGGVTDTIGGVTGTIDNTLGGLTDSINNTIGGVTDSVNNTIGGITDQINNTIGGVRGTIDETLGGVTDVINNTVGGVTDSISNTLGGVLGGSNGGGIISDTFGSAPGLGGLLGGGGGNVDVTLSPSQQAQGSTSIVSQTFARLIPRLSSGFQQAIPIQPGVLGIPDFTRAQATFQQAILSNVNKGSADATVQGADRFNVNPFGLASSLTGEMDRITARSVAASVLSEEGQLAMQQETEATQATLDAMVSEAETAQGLDVTQDIMKNLTTLEAQRGSIEASGIYHSQRLEQQLAAGNVVNTEISEALDERNRSERAQDFGAAAMLMRASSQTYIPGEN